MMLHPPHTTMMPLQGGAVPYGRIFRTVLDYTRSRTWLRFGLIGVVNAGFGYSLFALLVLAGLWPGAALAATMIVAIAFNFQTSCRLVFRSNGQIVRFVAVYSIVLAVNWIALGGLRWFGLSDLGSQALLTVPIAAISFLGQQRFVFGAT